MHTGRIFFGSKPAYLPVLQSKRSEIDLNLKAAKALGIVVPTATPLRARRGDRIARAS
jgi:putative ABC transport system substrate-binding protein